MALLLAVGSKVLADKPDVLRITRIEIDHNRTQEPTASRVSRSRRLPKFVPEGDESESGDLALAVYWRPPRQGAGPGVRVRLEYTQEHFGRAQQLEISYPFRVFKERRAEFIVPRKLLNSGGPVTAWRVRVLDGRRLLAERRSQAWGTE
jgi:hypothetical protein